MAERYSRYDSADYLQTESEIAEYLNACVAEGGDDPAFIAHALGVVARARGMMELAAKTGISRAGLYKALSGEGNPTFDTVARVAKALGLQVTFRPVPFGTSLATARRPKRRVRDAIHPQPSRSS